MLRDFAGIRFIGRIEHFDRDAGGRRAGRQGLCVNHPAEHRPATAAGPGGYSLSILNFPSASDLTVRDGLHSALPGLNQRNQRPKAAAFPSSHSRLRHRRRRTSAAPESAISASLHAIAFPHSPQNFIALGKLRAAVRANRRREPPSAQRAAFATGTPLRRSDFLDFRQHHGQFLLQRQFGLLIVRVGKFAHAVFELQVAQIFIDGGLALIQMLRGRNRIRRRNVLGANEQREERRDGDNQDGNGDQRSFSRACPRPVSTRLSIRPSVAASISGRHRRGMPLVPPDHQHHHPQPERRSQKDPAHAHQPRRDCTRMSLPFSCDELIQNLLVAACPPSASRESSTLACRQV